MENKAKNLERTELNNAIANFIKQGGKIKKLDVRDYQKESGSDFRSDFIDTYGDCGEPDRMFYNKVMTRNTMDF